MPDLQPGHPLPLLLVGYGLVGRRHAAAIEHSIGARLGGVVEPDPATRAEAHKLGAPVFDSLDAALSHGGFSGVVLATPNDLHVEQGMVCVGAGLPVLVEKPIATDVCEAETLVAAAEASGIALLVGHHRRHNPIIQAAKAALVSGVIGEVRAVQATCWFYKPDSYFEAAPWRKQKGAGPVAVNLIHDIDLLRHLCGDIVALTANSRPARRGYDTEDLAVAILEFENGALGTISVSDAVVSPWSWETTSGEYPVYPKTEENAYLIGGSDGALSIPNLRLWRHEGDEPDWWAPFRTEQLGVGKSDPLIAQIEHFAEVIGGRVAPLVSGREGLRSLQVVEALQRAALERGRVTVPN